jgi:hypothetical protein
MRTQTDTTRRLAAQALDVIDRGLERIEEARVLLGDAVGYDAQSRQAATQFDRLRVLRLEVERMAAGGGGRAPR